jgi:hypothetical protein
MSMQNSQSLQPEFETLLLLVSELQQTIHRRDAHIASLEHPIKKPSLLRFPSAGLKSPRDIKLCIVPHDFELRDGIAMPTRETSATKCMQNSPSVQPEFENLLVLVSELQQTIHRRDAHIASLEHPIKKPSLLRHPSAGLKSPQDIKLCIVPHDFELRDGIAMPTRETSATKEETHTTSEGAIEEREKEEKEEEEEVVNSKYDRVEVSVGREDDDDFVEVWSKLPTCRTIQRRDTPALISPQRPSSRRESEIVLSPAVTDRSSQRQQSTPEIVTVLADSSARASRRQSEIFFSLVKAPVVDLALQQEILVTQEILEMLVASAMNDEQRCCQKKKIQCSGKGVKMLPHEIALQREGLFNDTYT